MFPFREWIVQAHAFAARQAWYAVLLSWEGAVPQQFIHQPFDFKQELAEVISATQTAAQILVSRRAEALQLAAAAESEARTVLAERDSRAEQLQLDSLQQQELVSAITAIEKKMALDIWSCKSVTALREQHQVCDQGGRHHGEEEAVTTA